MAGNMAWPMSDSSLRLPTLLADGGGVSAEVDCALQSDACDFKASVTKTTSDPARIGCHHDSTVTPPIRRRVVPPLAQAASECLLESSSNMQNPLVVINTPSDDVSRGRIGGAAATGSCPRRGSFKSAACPSAASASAVASTPVPECSSHGASSPIAANDMPQIGQSSAANLQPHHLSAWHRPDVGMVAEHEVNFFANPLGRKFPTMQFLKPRTRVRGEILVDNPSDPQDEPGSSTSSRKELAAGCVLAGACRDIWWEPSRVRAGLVTCGGLCPGLNSIIREVTGCLWYDYSIHDIHGFEGGYHGLSKGEEYAPMSLTPDNVRQIHMKGGSVLKAGRGGFDADKICASLEARGINMLFVIGGDGTQYAGNMLYKAAMQKKLPISIVGVPKSIDNDVLFFDKTFGFDSAVAAAADVIRNGWVEASSCKLGVGIVKLMGRDAGFVAMHAALASTIVDLVLIPEVRFDMSDVFSHVDAVLERKGFMVIVVSEGAGQHLVGSDKKDATGHAVYGDIGLFMRDSVNRHLSEKGGRSFYIDPSYIIRSVPIRPNDHVYCGRLARDAVHTAMRGYTGVCVGALHHNVCIIPSKLVASGKRHVDLSSVDWQSCVQCCKMPAILAGYCSVMQRLESLSSSGCKKEADGQSRRYGLAGSDNHRTSDGKAIMENEDGFSSDNGEEE